MYLFRVKIGLMISCAITMQVCLHNPTNISNPHKMRSTTGKHYIVEADLKECDKYGWDGIMYEYLLVGSR